MVQCKAILASCACYVISYRNPQGSKHLRAHKRPATLISKNIDFGDQCYQVSIILTEKMYFLCRFIPAEIVLLTVTTHHWKERQCVPDVAR